MSLQANIPTWVSPKTDHFWVSQLGSQEWLINLARLPNLRASMISSPFVFIKYEIFSALYSSILDSPKSESIENSSPQYSVM